MTANLKALVREWREDGNAASPLRCGVYRHCADELSREIERMESEPRAQEEDDPEVDCVHDGHQVARTLPNGRIQWRCALCGEDVP